MANGHDGLLASGPRSLHEWFAEWMSRVSGRSLRGPPAAVLQELGAPMGAYPWAGTVADAAFPLRIEGGLAIPDLQSRGRPGRRQTGQYYTPETLVRRLLTLANLPPKRGALLDPACGDGAFLVPAAGIMGDAGEATPLSRLHGSDLDGEALLVCLARLLETCPGGGWPVLERRDFLLDPPAGGFAAVVGNPPYKVNLPPAVRESLAKRYSTAEGEKDLYTFFLEGGVEALRPGGSLVMLTSHTYLVNHHCSRIRDFLFREHRPRDLFLLPVRFFSHAPGVLPVILHLTREPHDGGPVRVWSGYSSEQGWADRVEARAEQLLRPGGVREVWTPPGLAAVFRRMESASVPLGSVARIGVGIQEATVREGRVSRFVRDSRQGPDDVPVLRGREIEPFRIRWDGKFLAYGPHLTYAGDPAVFRGEKILYQNLRNESLPVRLVAALDRSGFFPKNSLSWVAEPKAPFSLPFIVGLLNSTLVNAWFAGHFFSFHITVTQVRQIPVPRAAPPARGRVEQLVERILETPPDSPYGRAMLDDLDEAVAACFLDPGEVAETLSQARNLLAKPKGLC